MRDIKKKVKRKVWVWKIERKLMKDNSRVKENRRTREKKRERESELVKE